MEGIEYADDEIEWKEEVGFGKEIKIWFFFLLGMKGGSGVRFKSAVCWGQR